MNYSTQKPIKITTTREKLLLSVVGGGEESVAVKVYSVHI